MKIEPEILCGKTTKHLVEIPGTKYQIHREVLKPLQQLQAAADEAGFGLFVGSSFRGFENQMKIWNEKVEGKRTISDENGNVLKTKGLSEAELIHAILRWSALPGASRHHWGTDIDIYDKKSVPPQYHIQMIPQEVNEGGIFAKMHDWLDTELENYEFYRPYDRDRGGVSPERWHLSYRPVAEEYYRSYTENLLKDCINKSTMLLKYKVIAMLPEIFERYVLNTADRSE